jgi:lysophospholipase L1-like esterase
MKRVTNLSLSIAVCILAIVSISCKKEKNIYMTDSTTPAAPVSTPGGLKFLALGDSYTIGQNVQVNERFPAQTVQLLKTQGLNISEPNYIAVTGWTTINLLSAINQQKPAQDFNIVTLLIGVNDQYQRLDTAGYTVRFEELLNKAIHHAGNRKANVFVVSMPDYSATPFVAPSSKARVSMEIDQFNAINKRITQQYNISYTDITPSTKEAANDASLVANDGLHPSGKEYRKWANMLAPKIKDVLK